MLCPTQSATVRPERVSSRQSWTIRDREVPNAEPVRIVCLEVSGGLRSGYTEDGYRLHFSGFATRMWVTP